MSNQKSNEENLSFRFLNLNSNAYGTGCAFCNMVFEILSKGQLTETDRATYTGHLRQKHGLHSEIRV